MIGPKQQLMIRDAVKGNTVRIPYSSNTSWKSVGAVEIVKIKPIAKGMVQIKYLPMYTRNATIQKVDMPGDVKVTRESRPAPRPAVQPREVERVVQNLSPGQAVMVPSALGAGILSILGGMGIPVSLSEIERVLDFTDDGLSDKARKTLQLYEPLSGLQGTPKVLIESSGNID